jgi:hypothetical protein
MVRTRSVLAVVLVLALWLPTSLQVWMVCRRK